MFDSVILDADSMLFLSCYEEPSFERRKKNIENRVSKVCEDLEAPDVYVLVKGKGNFRIDMEVDYKGNRKEALTDEAKLLKERVAELAQWAGTDLAMPCDGAEADDYAGIIAYQMLSEGKLPVIAHIDKDLDQLVGYHYNYNTGATYFVTLEDAYRMLMKQCIMGDKTDNIQGLPKYGPVKVSKTLDHLPVEELWAEVQRHWEMFHGKNWKRYLTICANLVYMRTSEEDLRELSFEELNERFTWEKTNTDTGHLVPKQDRDLSQLGDLSTESRIDFQVELTSERKPSSPNDELNSPEGNELELFEANPHGDPTHQARSM